MRPLKQKTIGILGGSSNVATAAYYAALNAAANRRLGGWDIAETLISGMNFGDVEAFVRAEAWDALAACVRAKMLGLRAGGADFVLCVSNTLHRVAAPLAQETGTPFLHIAHPTGAAMQAAGVRRPALFGTAPTMQGGPTIAYFRDHFGIDAIVPNPDEIREIDRIIFDELCKDRIEQSSKSTYLAVADRMRREEGCDGLILGCTEIFLLIGQRDRPDLPMFDTMALHCEAAVAIALGEAELPKV
jgi:aspartate racemase